ncbi:DNA repair protein RecO [Rubidibacter lacunae KORDI 51-2]|uniref:DNA repair protein RecO n=1 Tax=Rubidibacter lacunae KORDI 51-2 TaxID=582515 RepID=U5DB58_9CHRO|nr:DNA repair protein RecO [Rubidibacter lacunae]ERN41778.1 DNA repair protein RecO [Rubidibacter lacunae KORDI 51-2]
MSRTYRATGITLRSTSYGEADRLLTVLTPEFGLVRAVANGARKPTSSLRGRCEPLAVNHWLFVRGRSLDKVSQVERIRSFTGVGCDLGKLAAYQYLTEIALYVSASDRSQADLYSLLLEHLHRLERVSERDPQHLQPYLAQGTFHLLAVAGIAPQVRMCCRTQEPIAIDTCDPGWRVGFSPELGGTVARADDRLARQPAGGTAAPSAEAPRARSNTRLRACELMLLQALASPTLPEVITSSTESGCEVDRAAWSRVERVLRNYAQYHCGRPIRSAALLDEIAAGAEPPSTVRPSPADPASTR